MEHPESEYIKRVLGEPLRDALAAIILYQPLDPIDFLATYLKRWAVKVRDNRIVSTASVISSLFFNTISRIWGT